MTEEIIEMSAEEIELVAGGNGTFVTGGGRTDDGRGGAIATSGG